MALYLPRGGDYERALRYVGQTQGVAGAMEGASKGLAIVMNMQKIADNALSMEIKEEERAESRAKTAAGILDKLDQLSGGLGDVVGAEGAVGTTRGKKARAAGAAGGKEKISPSDAAQLAEAWNTLAELEELNKLAGPLEKVSPTVSTLRGADVGQGAGSPLDERTVSEMVQALPVDETGRPTEELPSFMPQEDVTGADSGARIRAALSEVGLERGGEAAAELSALITGEEAVPDDQLSAAMERLGARDPGITARGADIPKPYDIEPGPPRVTGLFGEGMINPAAAMGLTGRTVLDPVSHMALYQLSRMSGGKALSNAVATAMGAEPGKMFAQGAVGRSAKYASKLAGALDQMRVDQDSEDLVGLTRVIRTRLKAADIGDDWTDEELDQIATDLAPMDDAFINQTIKELRSGQKFSKDLQLATIRSSRFTYDNSQGLKTKELLYKEAGDTLGNLLTGLRTAESNLAKKTQEYGIEGNPELQAKVAAAQEEVNGWEDKIKEVEDSRALLYKELGGPGKPPPLEAKYSVTLKHVDRLVSDAKKQGYDRATIERMIDNYQDRAARGEISIEPGFFEAVLKQFPEVVEEEKEPVQRQRTSSDIIYDLRAAEKALKSSGQTERDAGLREAARGDVKTLRRELESAEEAGEWMQRFTDAADAAEVVRRKHRLGKPLSKNQVKTSMERARSLADSMAQEFAWMAAIGRYKKHNPGRDPRDDYKELYNLANRLEEILGGM